MGRTGRVLLTAVALVAVMAPGAEAKRATLTVEIDGYRATRTAGIVEVFVEVSGVLSWKRGAGAEVAGEVGMLTDHCWPDAFACPLSPIGIEIIGYAATADSLGAYSAEVGPYWFAANPEPGSFACRALDVSTTASARHGLLEASASDEPTLCA